MKVILHTSNGSTHVALTNIKMFEKYWKNIEIILLGYEEILLLERAQLPDNVTAICMGKQSDFGKTWSTAMIPVLNTLEDEYFVLVPDDCVLMKEVDIEKVLFLEKLVQAGRVDKAILGGGIPLTDMIEYDEKLLVVYQNVPYRTSVIPAIWTKRYLLQYLKSGMTAHDFEVVPSQNDGAVIVNYNTGPNPENPHLFCFVNAYHKGKLTIDENLEMTCNTPQYRHYSKEDLTFIREDIELNKKIFAV